MSAANKKLWKSGWPYDPLAKEFRIDEKFIAFWRFTNQGLDNPKVMARTNGNVIHIDPEVEIDTEVTTSLLCHEAQHVVQFYQGVLKKKPSPDDILFDEKEACARQILYGPLPDRIIDGIVDNLEKRGMDGDE